MYVPDMASLEKARAKNSSICVIDSKFDNKIFEAFETYAFKKGIAFTNVAGWGHDEKRGMFRELIYWVKKQAPYLNLVSDYGQSHPKVSMRLYL